MNTTLRAALWMLGSIVAFSAMGVAGRELTGTLDTFEMMMYRSVIGLVIVSIVLTATGRWQVVTTERLPQQILRNITHFTGQNLWFYAIGVAPLAQVFALEFTTPLWVIVLSPLLLGEVLTRLRLLCAALGFAGILIVARPGIDTLDTGVVTALAAAVFFALTAIQTKRLTRAETIGGIMFWLTLIQLFLGIAASGYDGDIALPDAHALPFVLIIGVGGVVAHFCVTSALAIAPASVVMPFDFARLPTITVVAALMYSEMPDIWVFVGAVVIFGANYINILGENRRIRVAAAQRAG